MALLGGDVVVLATVTFDAASNVTELRQEQGGPLSEQLAADLPPSYAGKRCGGVGT